MGIANTWQKSRNRFLDRGRIWTSLARVKVKAHRRDVLVPKKNPSRHRVMTDNSTQKRKEIMKTALAIGMEEEI
jgi:hypothetical protein